MKKLSWILLFSLILAACKKEDNVTPSFWKMNEVEYSSENVTKTIISLTGRPSLASMDCHDYDRFDITFYSKNQLPVSGTYTIAKKSTDRYTVRDVVFLNFYKGTTIYSISPDENAKLKAEEYGGKAKYTLPLSWYINRSDPTDSIQVEGVFFEP